MSRELHHRKKDDKYALWSTITDSYITEWSTKKEIRDTWISDLQEDVIDKVDRYMKVIDKEV